MNISRSIRFSLMTATLILAGVIFTNPVMADPVVIQLGSFSGSIDPITYTIPEGTFTTSLITLTLNMSSPSFFTIDEATGAISAHTVVDVFFNDGRGNDLSGTFVIDETGMLGPQPIPMDVISGVLTGAGAFSGTTVGGINPTRFNEALCPIRWEIRSPGPDQPPPMFVDLPPGFINGDHIPIQGTCEACAVPEPATLVLLVTGLAGIGARKLKAKRKHL